LTTSRARRVYEFGPFRLCPEERTLLREGRAVAVTPRVFDILVALVEHRDRVIGREELMRKVWHDFAVEEANLTVSVSVLRKALGEGGGQQFVETVPKCGYRFVADVREVREEAERPETPRRVQALAVLPFLVQSAREDDQYLGLGLVEALVTRLSRIAQLAVRPTRSVAGYDARVQDPAAAGRELGVDAVISGSVRRAGERLRVSVQLVDARGGAVLWAETVDHAFADAFAFEDDVSTEVARALHLRLTADQAERLARPDTENSQAYRLYLQGRYFWTKRAPENLLRAIDCFERAIAEDPRFALAHAGLADAYILLSTAPPREVMPKAKAAAERALALDDTLAAAHASLAFVRENYDWDFAGAEAGYRRALALNPNYPTARQWFAEHLAARGRHEEGIEEINRARALDPLSLSIANSVARQFYLARRFDSAAEQCRHVLELDPSFLPALYRLGGILVQMGLFDEAVAQFRRALELSGGATVMLAELGYAYAAAGRREEADEVIARLQEASDDAHADPGHLTTIYAWLGRKDESFRWLEQCFDARSPLLIYLKVEPIFDPLRDDPRFHELLTRVGHAD
jgi:DNA-binding winged helix-turn-helix (wHTH) protein/tetratricopeptide (TPR) repeat protein